MNVPNVILIQRGRFAAQSQQYALFSNNGVLRRDFPWVVLLNFVDAAFTIPCLFARLGTLERSFELHVHDKDADLSLPFSSLPCSSELAIGCNLIDNLGLKIFFWGTSGSAFK
eukprot:TRINITY_DN277_c0_g1_i1.p2 TRINITY_DN277_c0_g1~~TRINITY_DN277_c0_g1_i1.p2  ORF type:complete len:113 (+),score=7.65 TRINITY_DN277_c0_g1_i1:226-564(+)